MHETIIVGAVATPLGALSAALSPRGLGYLGFGEQASSEGVAWARRWLPEARVVAAGSELDDLAAQLDAYFAGRLRAWSFPLYLRGTPFQLEVWQALQAIPYGQVRSYSDLAATIGHPRAVRAVGAANGANPISILVPCHRLIGKSGSLIKYGGGLERKRRLLVLEGVLS
jgi:O-6-methylguanine DNA methyltransferase